MRLFRICREEIPAALLGLLMAIGVNALAVCRYYGLIVPNIKGGFWGLFMNHYTVSGYDSLSYIAISNWGLYHSQYRHPLFPLMLWPASMLNKWCMTTFGVNLAQFIFAAGQLLLAVYCSVFAYRLLRRIVQVGRADALLLTSMLFSCAYVMTAFAVPDHFSSSLFLLLLTLLLAGTAMLEGRPMGRWTTAWLVILTSGVTLTNGVKTLIASWMTRGRSFFRPVHLLVTVALPVVLLAGACYVQYHTDLIYPNLHPKVTKKKSNVPPRRMGKPIGKSHWLAWTDAETPLGPTIVENLWGESIQLHQEYTLLDTTVSRPVIVRYTRWYNYVAEVLLAALFVVGLWAGRRERFLWLCLLWFGFDMLMHLGVRFAINEVYIMGCHWLFIFPIAVAYALRRCEGRRKTGLRLLIGGLTAYLWIYNVGLLAAYMLAR